MGNEPSREAVEAAFDELLNAFPADDPMPDFGEVRLYLRHILSKSYSIDFATLQAENERLKTLHSVGDYGLLEEENRTLRAELQQTREELKQDTRLPLLFKLQEQLEPVLNPELYHMTLGVCSGLALGVDCVIEIIKTLQQQLAQSQAMNHPINRLGVKHGDMTLGQVAALNQQLEAERDALQRRLDEAEKVITAARCVRHWHDRENGGMIVSGENVRFLWAALHDYDAFLATHRKAAEVVKDERSG